VWGGCAVAERGRGNGVKAGRKQEFCLAGPKSPRRAIIYTWDALLPNGLGESIYDVRDVYTVSSWP